ncbi:peptide chain release factor 2 [Macrococcoides caseolyticum]|uniref:peptide chain release factor 2 n=1 Tax=Macrococcoides caseolyticum TaxID=69966 RepID=UPI001E302296|nr:peptide chain release factor 2 [Macrococcus caseolyticus]MDJ1088939.1 peptide chain release factor 2 [Macrococcus caseolyticus]MDJ1153070.1 peptide chain release factor 2 [Macrococcus caseolyticus]MDJ1155051.1 peptide chain release factor 2 [Macrococcus caseolyticus]
MEQFEIKNTLETLAEKIDSFRGSLDLEEKETSIKEYEEMMADPDFWNDGDKAQDIINKNNALKSVVQEFSTLEEGLENSEVLFEMYKEESDEDTHQELIEQLNTLQQIANDFELKMLLSGEFDANNAILELHPGAGGTESQDWGEMLLRMYQRFADKKGFKVETVDYLPGDEAGIKSVTLLIKGHNAYGYLKAEKGVHRLVRISPFDSSGRRHTSFVSCEVTPEFDNDNIEVEINSEDIKIDTYRASGAGGQHVNTTDSAVRITHQPTGIVVTCQNERSQIKNREQAMKMLKAKLYQKKIEEQEAELAAIRGEQKEIGWGSQIRSYVFHPYSMVKDHRTNAETGNTNAVMDGDIDLFIDAYLKSQL